MELSSVMIKEYVNNLDFSGRKTKPISNGATGYSHDACCNRDNDWINSWEHENDVLVKPIRVLLLRVSLQ